MEKGDRVLVTGATGFTGTCLVKKLVAQGLQVRAIARPSSNISAFDGMDIEWIRADVFDREALKQASQGLQYVFHVAACFREAGVPDDYYRKVHVESTQHLAEFASANPDFKRFVHVSTMGVHGHIENPPANEESPFAPGDLYQVTKLEAEQWLHNFAAEKKLPYTVIRPMAIFGPGDKRLLKVFKMASKPVFPVLGFGKCLYHLIHVEDLSDAMIHAADEPRALGEAFLCGNTEAIGLIDMGKIIASELGSRFIVLRLPVTPFFLAWRSLRDGLQTFWC